MYVISMYVISTAGNLSNCPHRSMQDYCLGSPDGLACENHLPVFLCRVHSKLSLMVRSPLIRADISNAA